MVKDVVISLDRPSRSRLPSPNPREYHERSDEDRRRNEARNKKDKENRRDEREQNRINELGGTQSRGIENNENSDERGRSRERILVGVDANPDMISIMGFGGGARVEPLRRRR